MKQFLLLVGGYYYPAGWDDFQGSFDTQEQAEKEAMDTTGIKL